MRKMKIALSPGSIGVECTQEEAIGLAHYFGYEAVQPNGRELAAFSSTRLSELPGELSAFGLVWAAAGLGVDFRKDEPLFQEGLRNWSREVKALQQAGVTRVGTWIMPTHDSLTYLQNFKQHVRRLREVALIAEDHGMRLGLEYVGTKSLWSSKAFPFVHTMVETQELIAEIGKPNVGFVLDSWHWWTAEEGSADILALRNVDGRLVRFERRAPRHSQRRAARYDSRTAAGHGSDPDQRLSGSPGPNWLQRACTGRALQQEAQRPVE